MNKLILLFLILTTIGYGQYRVRGIDLHSSAKDTIKAIVSDSITAVEASSTNYDSVRAIVADSVYNDPNGLYVPAQYSSVSSALSAASTGDIIYIGDGTYTADLTLKNNLTLIGNGKQNSYINGSITATGNNHIQNLKVGTLKLSYGDTVTVVDSKLFIEDTYIINQSSGVLKLENVEFEFNTAEPSIYISGGKTYINGSKLYGAKADITGDSTEVHISNSEVTIANGGSNGIRIYDSTKVIVNNSFIHPVDSNNEYTDAAKQGLVKSIVAYNNSRYEFSNSRVDNNLSVVDSADIYLQNHVGMYRGRIGGKATSTSEAEIRARNFYLHVDYGSQNGSHLIETDAGGDATYYLQDGTLEYMGDWGEFDQIGNLCAGGGEHTWINLNVIDWGSALNSGYTYGQTPMYNLGTSGNWFKMIDCDVYAYADTLDVDANTNRYAGFRINVATNDTLRIRIENSTFHFKPEYDDFYFGLQTNELGGGGSRYIQD